MSHSNSNYEGWENYPTWAVALWVDNNPKIQRKKLNAEQLKRTVLLNGKLIREILENSIDWDALLEHFQED